MGQNFCHGQQNPSTYGHAAASSLVFWLWARAPAVMSGLLGAELFTLQLEF